MPNTIPFPSAGGGSLTDQVNDILALSSFGSTNLESLVLHNRGVAGVVTYTAAGIGTGQSFGIKGDSTVTSILCGSLTSCAGSLQCSANSSLTTVGLGALVSCAGIVSLSGCNALTSFSAASLTSCGGTFSLSGCTALASVTLSGLSTCDGQVNVSGCTSLTSLTLSALTSIGGSLLIYACTSLASLSLAALSYCDGYANFSGCTSLTSLTLSGLTSMIGTMDVSGCTSLVTIAFPGYVSIANGFSFNASGCALDVTSVDAILAAFAAGGGGVTIGTLNLSGGTNASPTDGMSNTAYLTLTGAGITVNIN
jgi:hypothetical protein